MSTAQKALLQRIKERERQKADLGNRKSLASQMRMKTLANLASDAPSKKRRRGGDDDNFGANDEDWGVYRTVAMGEQSEEEEEEDLDAEMKTLEAQLLKFDPSFSESKTMAAQNDWTKSLMHVFLHGPRPFNAESQQETHQLHLNVERIRVPEVVFQPAIAGLDQAGIVNIAADMANHGMANPQDRINILKDVFLTGGNTLFKGFEERLHKELRAVLPIDASMRIRRAGDPLLDAWKGAVQWSNELAYRQARVTREDYLEKGSEYMKVRKQILSKTHYHSSLMLRIIIWAIQPFDSSQRNWVNKTFRNPNLENHMVVKQSAATYSYLAPPMLAISH